MAMTPSARNNTPNTAAIPRPNFSPFSNRNPCDAVLAMGRSPQPAQRRGSKYLVGESARYFGGTGSLPFGGSAPLPFGGTVSFPFGETALSPLGDTASFPLGASCGVGPVV